MSSDLSKPLLGMRILITRPTEQTAEISETITRLGGVPIGFPTIRIAPPSDYSQVDRAASLAKNYDWLVFTSANGVRYFFERAIKKGIGLTDLSCKIAAVGTSTALALEGYGLKVSFIPSSYLTEKLASELPYVDDKRILLVRAEGTDAKMKSILKGRGARVDEVYAYRVLAYEHRETAGNFDAILFTSPSTVSGFKTIISEEPAETSRSAIVCCIGPVTAEAARALGFKVDVVSTDHTTEGLLNALVEKVKSK